MGYNTQISIILILVSAQSLWGQLHQAPTHYVHPHEAYYKLQQAEAASPSLKNSQQQIKTMLNVVSDPLMFFKSLQSSNSSMQASLCTNQTMYALAAVLESWPDNGWAEDSK